MFRILVEIFVSIFVIKKKRAHVKRSILSFPNKIQIIKRAKRVGKNFSCSGAYKTIVNRHTEIGDGCSINGLLVYGDGDVVFGDYVVTGADCVICSDNHNYEGESLPFDTTIIRKKVEIGSYVWMGTRCTILPGTKIGEGAIIQAGSVVHGEIPPCAIAGGNPAKVFKYRDIERFNKLKEEKKFFCAK